MYRLSARRCLKTTQSGGRTYLQITKAYRDPETGKPRQRHIANLGRIDKLVEADLDSLIEGLLKVTGCPSLAERSRSTAEIKPLPSSARWAWRYLCGDADLLTSSPCAKPSPEWPSSASSPSTWRSWCASWWPTGCRIPAPSGLLEWVETVALPGVEQVQVTHSNLLLAIDFIAAHKEQLEQELTSTFLCAGAWGG